MKKVKITVLKRTIMDDLIKEYGRSGIGACKIHEEGQVFYCSDGWRKPEGLCENAWKSMMEYVMTLAHGGGNFYNGFWNKPNIATISCNDGLRPVIFKLETDEEN